jgi:hypothetical protein
MNPSGKSSGGGSKGKASKGKASGGDVITKQYALTTQRSHLLVLRKALQTDEGKDKDVTQPFAAFMKYSRNGLDATLRFMTGAKLEKSAQRGAKKLVELLAQDALTDCGLTVEDKARARSTHVERRERRKHAFSQVSDTHFVLARWLTSKTPPLASSSPTAPPKRIRTRLSSPCCISA